MYLPLKINYLTNYLLVLVDKIIFILVTLLLFFKHVYWYKTGIIYLLQ